MIFFFLKQAIALGGIIKLHLMSNNKRWIDFIFFNFFKKNRHVFLHMGLTCFDRQAFIHRRSDRDFIAVTDIHARHRNSPAFAATLDGLP